MADPLLEKTDPLDDFEHRQITLQDKTKLVFVAGTGPAVIVMTEDARHLAARRAISRAGSATPASPCGCRACSAHPGVRCRSATRWARSRRRHQLWVPRLRRQRVEPGHAAAARARGARAPTLGRQGVGAIGMCFTGNFALSMMLEPAMPRPSCRSRRCRSDGRAARTSPPTSFAQVKERLEREEPHRPRLPLRRRQLLQGRALRRLRAGARRPLRGTVLPDSVRESGGTDEEPAAS